MPSRLAYLLSSLKSLGPVTYEQRPKEMMVLCVHKEQVLI